MTSVAIPYLSCGTLAVRLSIFPPTPAASLHKVHNSHTTSSHAAFELLYPRAKSSYNLTYSLNLIKLELQFIDIPKNSSKPGNLIIRHLYGISRSIVLRSRRDLGRLVELAL